MFKAREEGKSSLVMNSFKYSIDSGKVIFLLNFGVVNGWGRTGKIR